jgi:hypothetical protein
MTKDPMPKPTFASFAEAFAEEDRIGRYGTDKPPVQIVGTAPVPNYPGRDQEDPVGPEPPLGLAVGDHPEPVGTFQEIQASIDRLRKPDDDQQRER